jgi:hypothetical protein
LYKNGMRSCVGEPVYGINQFHGSN